MKSLVILIFISCLIFMVSCDEQETPEEAVVAVYSKISAEGAYQMMQDTKEYILLDVRTQEEFNTEHIEGAALIPFDEVGDRAGVEIPDKNALILVYCRSGRRSEAAAQELVEMGYTSVYDFGGILDWPFDTVLA